MSPPVIPPGTTTLSEADSKRLLAAHGVPFAVERDCGSSEDAVAAESLGYPVVVTLNAEAIAHKTERGLVRVSDRVDGLLPARCSRSNPIDCAGGETRDTVLDLLRVVAADPCVDAVVDLGMGIQSNQAKLMGNGPFFPGHGLDRIVEYHERQDVRFAQAAADASAASGKPVLTASELAVADPTNAGPAMVRATGRLCYPSSSRAVRALHHTWRYARYRQRRAGG